MKRLTVFSTVLTATFCTAALADLEEDRAVIAKYWLSKHEENTRSVFSRAYADVYSKELLKDAVKIRDLDEFARLLPLQMTDPHVRASSTKFRNHCMARISAEDTGQLADVIRDRPDLLENAARSPADRELLPDQAIWALLVCCIAPYLSDAPAIRRNGTLPADYFWADVADVLETPGIASFPNRIVKNNLLRDLRKRDAR